MAEMGNVIVKCSSCGNKDICKWVKNANIISTRVTELCNSDVSKDSPFIINFTCSKYVSLHLHRR